ncbi:hypothetical protein BT69DRAFT_1138841 [Atractiella rhizophila]|nr:hypothetical protein BT69DRAFT_1138841 [Atractiella rhizophila]
MSTKGCQHHLELKAQIEQSDHPTSQSASACVQNERRCSERIFCLGYARGPKDICLGYAQGPMAGKRDVVKWRL